MWEVFRTTVKCLLVKCTGIPPNSLVALHCWVPWVWGPCPQRIKKGMQGTLSLRPENGVSQLRQKPPLSGWSTFAPATRHASPPRLPWRDSQNPLKDKTSPCPLVPNSQDDLVAHSCSELGTPVGGRWKGGLARSSISTTVPRPWNAAADKGSSLSQGVQRKSAPPTSSEGGENHC